MSKRQTLCLLPPPNVWDTNHGSYPLPVGLTLGSPTVGISGIDYAQKLNPESGGHDEEPYARLRGVRHIQTRRCVRITACSPAVGLHTLIHRATLTMRSQGRGMVPCGKALVGHIRTQK